MDKATQTEIEAAAFRSLRVHLINRSDVQNIDMMNLTGFCRNCLSRWYEEAAKEQGVEISKLEAREIFYGMPFDDWKKTHQTDSTTEQQTTFKRVHKEIK
ncbi:MAG: DUF1244 domain-containing protein [Proteobacteria bacterium]|jgi:hypothetical protein|nr:DUF1244 domain-containing protein [Pseudomonadota bacterium]